MTDRSSVLYAIPYSLLFASISCFLAALFINTPGANP